MVVGRVGVMLSYGAATAIEWAGTDPRITAVVAVAPFASLRAVVPGYAPLLPGSYVQSAIDVAGREGDGGILPSPGARGNATVEPPPLDPSYGGQVFAALVRRADDPLRAGDTIALTDMTVVVREVSVTAGPTAERFTFAEPLESPSPRWLAWHAGRYVPFALPPLGGTVKLAAASMLPP
jgi:hypothetical protein